MFNSDQNSYMDYLHTRDPKHLCYCGWYDFGKCPNSRPFSGLRGHSVCIAGETGADKLHDIAILYPRKGTIL